MQTQKLRRRLDGKATTDEYGELPEPKAQERDAEKDAELDALLEDIDEVLTENAAEFVAEYVQKGGQ